jgi:transposase
MLAAVDGQTGAVCGQREIPASDAGALDALRFAADLDGERVWAIEDCRHVSARLEAALIAAGERVIRVPAAMTSQTRKVARQAGKSDPTDARAVALAVVRDGIESFPVAFTDEPALEIRVLCDYREQIICERTRMINGCAGTWSRSLPSSPRSSKPTCHSCSISPGCGTVTAAIIIGHTAGAQRRAERRPTRGAASGSARASSPKDSSASAWEPTSPSSVRPGALRRRAPPQNRTCPFPSIRLKQALAGPST